MSNASLMTLIGEAKRKWTALGIPIRPGASVERIRLLEDRLGRKLPSSFATWLRETGGMRIEEYDAEMMRFWPIEEIEEGLPLDQEHKEVIEFLTFIDWSISAHFYGVKLWDEQASVWLLGGPKPMRVARSFEEFLREYLRDPMSMFRET